MDMGKGIRAGRQVGGWLSRKTNAALVLALATSGLVGCGGSEPGAPSGNGGTGGTGNTATMQGTCTETALFSARPLGVDMDDLYRKIRVDPSTQELFLSDFDTIFHLPRGGGE